MLARELKDKFVIFFVAKGHLEIPSASLVPENDPSTLFVSAGIQPLVPYFLGKKHPVGSRLVNVQKCVRTGDIEQVGDTVHHTFFEMLGNWSLGDYFKDDMIPWSFEFLTKVLYIPVEKLAITCFIGDADAAKDEETAKLWMDQGVSESRIAFLPKANNWWGPPGVTGPCGTDTEMFYWVGSDPVPETFDPNNTQWVEIWNDVLIQYFKNNQGKFEKLIQNNIDTGMGVERTTAALNGLSDNYLTPIWQPIINKIEEVSQKTYQNNLVPMRIIADHIRSAVFIIADGVEPSNKERGYVLRRLIRRSIRQAKILGIEQNMCSIIAQAVIDNQDNYAGIYPELNQNKEKILSTLETEENKFNKTLTNGLKEIQRMITSGKTITGQDAFRLYESFGFPVEMITEELSKSKIFFDINDFNTAKDEHAKLSQTLSAGKFKSGLADNSEIMAKYHTATHLLHAALRQILGTHVQQSGSNITADRLRFDFSHPEKLTSDQLAQVEALVNQKIGESLPVSAATMKFTKAQKSGALAFFGSKYLDTVSVYTIGDFSSEVCTGPHVTNTAQLGKFRITREESAGSGKRRIYAVL